MSMAMDTSHQRYLLLTVMLVRFEIFCVDFIVNELLANARTLTFMHSITCMSSKYPNKQTHLVLHSILSLN